MPVDFFISQNTTCNFVETEQRSGMNPFLKNLDGTTTGTNAHAHLLVTESDGLVARESPAAVMAEVEFRTTHIGALLEQMFAEAGKHDCFWQPDQS
jgi:hypothetical protein